MLDPKAHGEFEPWAALAPTLEPLLDRNRSARCSCRGAMRTPRAIAAGSEEFTVKLVSGEWTQKPQKYHARSLAVLRARLASVRSAELSAVLQRSGCLQWLA